MINVDDTNRFVPLIRHRFFQRITSKHYSTGNTFLELPQQHGDGQTLFVIITLQLFNLLN